MNSTKCKHSDRLPEVRGAGTEAANHLRAWRIKRGFTGGELGKLIGTSAGVISLLESGKRGLDDRWLIKLAAALETTPGRILDYAPDDAELALIVEVLTLPPEKRELAGDLLRALAGRP